MQIKGSKEQKQNKKAKILKLKHWEKKKSKKKNIN